jgi:hypothetical protein
LFTPAYAAPGSCKKVEGDKVVGKGVCHVISSKRTREQRTIHKNLRDFVFGVGKSVEEESIRMQNNLVSFFFLETGGHGEAFPPLAQVPSGWKIVVTAAFTVMNLADTLTNLLRFGVRRGKSFMKS